MAQKLNIKKITQFLNEEYKEYCKVDPQYAYEDECKSENSSKDE